MANQKQDYCQLNLRRSWKNIFCVQKAYGFPRYAIPSPAGQKKTLVGEHVIWHLTARRQGTQSDNDIGKERF